MPSVKFVHRYFWPSNISTYPVMLKDIVEDHVRQGDDVSIVTAYATEEERQEREAWAQGLGVSLHHIRLNVDRGRGVAHRIWTTLRFSAYAMGRVIRRRPDRLSVTSYPIMTPSLPLSLYSRITKTPQLFYVQDIFSQNLTVAGGWRRWIGAVMKRLERFIVKSSRIVVTLSSDMKRTLGNDDHIAILQNYAPTEGVIREGFSDEPVLIYAGNMGVAQNLPHFLEACAEARKKEAFSVLMLGGGSMLETLTAQVKDQELDFVRFHSMVSRDEATEIISGCDIGVVAAQPGLFTYAFPSKAFTYWSCGLPTLLMCDEGSAFGEEIRAKKIGVPGDTRDKMLLADSVVEIVRSCRTGDLSKTDLATRVENDYGKAAFFSAYTPIVRDPWMA